MRETLCGNHCGMWGAVVTSHIQVWPGKVHSLDLRSVGAEVVGAVEVNLRSMRITASSSQGSSSRNSSLFIRPFLWCRLELFPRSITLNLFLHFSNDAINICCLKQNVLTDTGVSNPDVRAQSDFPGEVASKQKAKLKLKQITRVIVIHLQV